MFLNRLPISGCALVCAMAASTVQAEARPGVTAVTCTNTASGASWQISIDYAKSTVDSYPARISAGEITWHDAGQGGNDTLDRQSGDLTVIVPSSTGGYILHHRCKLDAGGSKASGSTD